VYYKARNGGQEETTLGKLPDLMASGAITQDTIIWMDGLDDWTTLGEAKVDVSIPDQLRNTLTEVSDDTRQKMLKTVWQRADTSGDGELDADEIRAVLIKMGRDEAELDMEQAMKELDANGDGSVDFGEFEAWFMRQEQDSQERMYVVYYKARNGGQEETTLGKLPDLMASGAITQDTIIWMDGLDDWTSLKDGLSQDQLMMGGRTVELAASGQSSRDDSDASALTPEPEHTLAEQQQVKIPGVEQAAGDTATATSSQLGLADSKPVERVASPRSDAAVVTLEAAPMTTPGQNSAPVGGAVESSTPVASSRTALLRQEHSRRTPRSPSAVKSIGTELSPAEARDGDAWMDSSLCGPTPGVAAVPNYRVRRGDPGTTNGHERQVISPHSRADTALAAIAPGVFYAPASSISNTLHSQEQERVGQKGHSSPAAATDATIERTMSDVLVGMQDAVEMVAQRDLFHQIDKDGDGHLSSDEINDSLSQIAHSRLTEEDLAQVVCEMDTSKSGAVGMEEFRAWWRSDSSIAGRLQKAVRQAQVDTPFVVTAGDMLAPTGSVHGSPIPMPASAGTRRADELRSGSLHAMFDSAGSDCELPWAADRPGECPSPRLSGAHIPGQMTVAPRQVLQSDSVALQSPAIDLSPISDVSSVAAHREPDEIAEPMQQEAPPSSPSPSPSVRLASDSGLEEQPRRRSAKLSSAQQLLKTLSDSLQHEQALLNSRQSPGSTQQWRRLHSDRKREWKVGATVRDSHLSSHGTPS
jgi:Ca2+-binding EF-hand superfamily protein